MAEYIERDAAKRELVASATNLRHPANLVTDDALFVLDSMPTADVAPVIHGQWIEYQIPHIICCSNCDWGTDVAEKNFQYCPNCGAKMDGGTDDGA